VTVGEAGGVQLPVAWAVVLVVTALWNLLIWPRFFQRVAKDPRARDAAGRPTRFYTVHAVLIGLSLLLALAVGVLGVVALV
jgi:capsule polysaccharide export protein KpsE/RkpR